MCRRRKKVSLFHIEFLCSLSSFSSTWQWWMEVCKNNKPRVQYFGSQVAGPDQRLQRISEKTHLKRDRKQSHCLWYLHWHANGGECSGSPRSERKLLVLVRCSYKAIRRAKFRLHWRHRRSRPKLVKICGALINLWHALRLPKQHEQRALLQQMEHRIGCYNNNYTKLLCGRKQKVFYFDTFIVRPIRTGSYEWRDKHIPFKRRVWWALDTLK